MFSEPQTVTISGSAKTLNRTGTSNDAATYATADRAHVLSIQHTYGKRTRHSIRLRVDTLDANPLISGQNVRQSASYVLTADLPAGYDTATAKAAVDGLLANLSASTGANITKLVGGES